MLPRRFAAGYAGAAILAAAICNGPCNSAHAQGRLNAEYTASIAGIPVGNGVWTVTIGDKEYTAEVTGRVAGLLSWVTSGEGSIVAQGTVNRGNLSATDYEAEVKYSVGIKSKKFAAVRMKIESRTVKDLAVEASDPPNRKNIPVTEEHKRGIVDPITASLIPVAGTGEALTPRACEQTLPVFDGNHRFNLALSFKRMEDVQTDQGYRGPAVVCGVNYQPIAGYNPDRSTIKYLMNNRDMEIWLTPIAGTRILAPFRISVPTKVGIAVLQAKQFVTVPQEPGKPTSH